MELKLAVEEQMTGAHVPLRDLLGRSKGVISCVNRSKEPGLEGMRPFSYEDVAIVAAIAQAFVHQMEILLADRRRLDSLSKLAHELRVPVVAFRAALERLEEECRFLGYVRFRRNHFAEMGIYTDVMRRLLTELEFIQKGPRKIPMEFNATNLVALIIQPARQFVEPLLRRHGLSVEKITHEGLNGFPMLYVDRGMMTQVVFNLLDNAIKYYDGAPANFSILIRGTACERGYEISFQDNGPGVRKGQEERIFEFGVRDPDAHLKHVAGEGIGLWMARGIVQRHGGTLELRTRKNPTEFVMWLPEGLKDRSPPEPLSEDES